MIRSSASLALALSLLATGSALAQPALHHRAVLTGPPERPLTPPASIVSPKAPGAAPIPVETLFATVGSSGAVWAADGRSIIMAADFSGRMNLWVQPLGGGNAVQIARSDDRQWGQQATPDGKTVAFQSDRGGREIYDLYATAADGSGQPVNLTATDDVSETSAVLSRDGALVAYGARKANEGQTNLGVLDLKTRQARLLIHEADPSMMWTPIAFSGDGGFLIANRRDVLGLHGAAYRVDLKSGQATRLTAEESKSVNQAGDLSPDDRQLSLTVRTDKGDLQAAVMDMASGRVTLLRPDAWEQDAGRFSPDGRTLLATSNVDGRDTVIAYDLAERQARVLPLPAGQNSGGDLPAFSPDGTRILFPHQSGGEPSEFWVMDVKTGKAAPVTHMADLGGQSLPHTAIVHYKSADGTVISAVLWIPSNMARDGHGAGIVYPHGGPTGQTRDRFDRTALALASRGYFVLAPNPRGSTGYGQAFMEANQKDLGGGDLEDEVAGAKFLAATGYVDAKKVGITGGSYGGYMTLIAISKTPDLWAAAVDEYGIVNWASMYERGSPQLREYQRGLLGDPVNDKAVYEAASPLTYLGQTKAPLLVLQGENDIRVPREESEQIVDFLKAHGRTVDVHYYPEEGHGFAKKENQVDAAKRTVDWFERYLKVR